MLFREGLRREHRMKEETVEAKKPKQMLAQEDKEAAEWCCVTAA